MIITEEQLIQEFHNKMKDLITGKCPRCEFILEMENLGDDDCPKPYLICNKCHYSVRL